MSPHSRAAAAYKARRARGADSLPPPLSSPSSIARCCTAHAHAHTARHGARRTSSGSSPPAVLAGVALCPTDPRPGDDDDARGTDIGAGERGGGHRGVRLRRRRRGGGDGDHQGGGRAGGAAAEADRGGVHPGVGRGGGAGPAAGPLRRRAAPRRGRLLRCQGVRGRGHPGNRHGAHPARRLRRARALLLLRRRRRQQQGLLPLRRVRRHVLRHGHHDGRLLRRGVLPAVPLPQGAPRRRRCRRRRRRPRRGGRRRARRPRARAHARDAWTRARPRRRHARRCLASGRLCRRVHQAPGDFSGSGAGNPGALGDHRRVAGRLAEAVHHQAPRWSSQLPPVLRGHRPWWLHCSGKVQGQGNCDHGDLLLPHRSHGHRAGDRHHFQLQQAQRHRPGRRGGLQRSCSRDSDLHVPCRSPRSRFQQPKTANEHEASAGNVHLSFPRRRAHVIARQMGIEDSQIHLQR